MSGEREPFLTLYKITDDDTGMYRIGEIGGIFDEAKLKQYLETHGYWGRQQLLDTISYLNYQIVVAGHAINAEKASDGVNCSG